MATIPDGAQAYIADPLQKKSSEIQDFYNDTNIFITGGSGFLGSLLIEKLLRSCSGVSRIYLLIRDKKGKSPETRIKDLFNEVVSKIQEFF